MGQHADEIRASGADILAVAVTATFAQQAFAATLPIDFPLLSDWNREVSPAYGAAYESWKGHDGLAKRAIFVIDPARVVRYRWVTDDAMVMPDFADVMSVLRSLRNA